MTEDEAGLPVAAALKQTEERLAREVSRAKTLQSISTRLISESRPESLYAQILGAAIELMASDAASVQMLAADHSSLKLLAWRGFHVESAAFWQEVTVGTGSTCSKALGDNERVVVSDIDACGFISGTQDQQEYRRSGIRAVQSTPLRSRSGRPLGMLSTHWQTPHTPTEEDFRFFDVLARQAADLIERTLAEDALRESEERFRQVLSTVSQKLIEAHEEERSRIARELHDDINQRLTFLTVRLEYLKQNPPSAAIFQQEVSAVTQHITELVSDIQVLSHRLHPSRLELLGLESAATAFCQELSDRHGVKIDFHVENVPKALPPEIALCLYRVLQEALQNVVKHSEPPHARVSLTGRTNDVRLTVKDSGAGFDPREAMRGRGLGLTSMRERVKVVDGKLFIRSEPGQGTMVQAVVPLLSRTPPLNRGVSSTRGRGAGFSPDS